MNDFEQRLRAAMHDAVGGAQPPPNLAELVKRRNRRHRARVAVAVPPPDPQRPAQARARSFPRSPRARGRPAGLHGAGLGAQPGPSPGAAGRAGCHHWPPRLRSQP